jgi:phosphinothricin acetyltransferase
MTGRGLAGRGCDLHGGLATGIATFETRVPAWEEWDAGHLPAPRLVAETGSGHDSVGWAALSPVSARPCYSGVAEVTVYVAAAARGQGVGRALLARLVTEAPEDGLWTLQASVFAANAPSLALHRRCGFREVGRRERIAQRDEAWHDTVLLELRLPG